MEDNPKIEKNELSKEQKSQEISGLAMKHSIAFLEEAFEKDLIEDSEEIREVVTLVMANLAKTLLEQGGDVSDLETYAYTIHPFLKENIEKIIELATHDQLTGALNRFGLEWFIAENDEDLVALLAIDLDSFKKVNDEHGHSQGDTVLKEIYKVMQDSLRDGDKVARTGGDEFTAILCDNKTDDVDGNRFEKKAPTEIIDGAITRMKTSVEEYLNRPGNEYLRGINFDISVGGEVWQKDKSYEFILHAADLNMMGSKREKHVQNGGSYR